MTRRLLFTLGIFVVGSIAGLVVAATAASFVQYSNSLEFCTGCHEMVSTVYEEYKETTHYKNKYGVRATCAHCHVPHHNWVATLWRKTRASFNELPNHFLGTLDTVEKFETHRQRMAEAVWAEMRANDSRECRYCHDREAMVLADQSTRARKQHENAREEGETCIDCHDGLVHKLPGTGEEEESEGFTFD